MEKESVHIISIVAILFVIVYLVVGVGCVYPFCKESASRLTGFAAGDPATETGSKPASPSSVSPIGGEEDSGSEGKGKERNIYVSSVGDEILSLSSFLNQIKFVDGFNNIILQETIVGDELGKIFIQPADIYKKSLSGGEIIDSIIVEFKSSSNDDEFNKAVVDYLPSLTLPLVPTDAQIDVSVSEDGTITVYLGEEAILKTKDKNYVFSVYP